MASYAAQAAEVRARETQLSSELEGVRAELKRATLAKQTLGEQNDELKLRVRVCDCFEPL